MEPLQGQRPSSEPPGRPWLQRGEGEQPPAPPQMPCLHPLHIPAPLHHCLILFFCHLPLLLGALLMLSCPQCLTRSSSQHSLNHPPTAWGHGSAWKRQESCPQTAALDRPLMALGCPPSPASPLSSPRCRNPPEHPPTAAVIGSPEPPSTTVPSADVPGPSREPGHGGWPRVSAGESW